jgi:protoporphyrinogen/coproporphyrinogen III oxidase
VSKSAVVVGAGLSGLAAAYRLQAAGLAVTVLERSDRIGGMARTERHQDYVVDTGCDLLNRSFVRYLALADELGLEVVPASQVVDFLREGRPVEVDRSRLLSLPHNPVLSLRGKWALARGYLRLRHELAALDPYALTNHAAEDDGNAHELCRRYFDDEVTEWVIDPVLRAFAGTGTRHASGLSVLGALAVGTKEMVAVTGGMAALPQALAQRLDVRCGASVAAIDDRRDGVVISYRDARGHHELPADACIVAVSYHDALGMWPALAAAAPEFARRVKSVPLVSVSLGYGAPSPTRAYSVLVPSRESADALLIMMQQNKAADRAPPGTTLATLYVEAVAAARFLERSDDEIVGWAAELLESYYPALTGRRELQLVTRWPHTGYWPFPGYWQGIARMRRELPQRNVHATSTLFGSGGVERAVLGGERAARRLLEGSV